MFLSEQTLIKYIKVGLYAVLFTPILAHPFIPKTFIFPFVMPKVFAFHVLVEIIFALWLVLILYYPRHRPFKLFPPRADPPRAENFVRRRRISLGLKTFSAFGGSASGGKRSPLFWSLLTLLTLLTVSSFFGVDFQRSFWSNQERAAGLFTLFHFFAFFLVLSSVFNQRQSVVISGNQWKNYFLVSLAVSFFASIFAFIQLVYPDLFLEKAVDRPGSFLGNPTFLASYLLPHIFIGLWLFVETLINADFGGFMRIREKTDSASIRSNLHKSVSNILPWLLLIIILFETLVIFFTQTRGAIIALAAAFLALLVYFSFKKQPDHDQLRAEGANIAPEERISALYPYIRKASLILLILFTLFTLLFFFTRSAPVWQQVPGLSRITDLSLESRDIQPRLIALQISWKSFFERPFLGWGWENFKYPFDKNYDPKLLRYGFVETYFDKPHNILLEYLVNGGILGLLAFLSVLAAAFYILFRAPDISGNQPPSAAISGKAGIGPMDGARPFILAALVAYFINNVFVFDTFGSYLMLFAVLAFIDSSSSPPPSSFSSPSPFLSFKKNTQLTLLTLLTLSTASLVYVNASTLYANNRQYWGANYFLNRMPEAALNSYADALRAFTPFDYQIRRDFASVLSQVYNQGIQFPETEAVVKKAMEGLAVAITQHPYDYSIRLTFGDISTVFYVFDEEYLKIGEEQVLKAMELSPGRQQNYYALAKIKILQGEKETALDLMRRAVELDPDTGDPHFYYGLLALEAGRIELGFKELEVAKGLGRDYKTFEEVRVLANYYADDGDYHTAIGLYKEALRLNPNDPESKLKLGIVHFFNEQYELSREIIGAFLLEVPEFRQNPNFEQIRPIVEALNL